jgi:hypothetical protein
MMADAADDAKCCVLIWKSGFDVVVNDRKGNGSGWKAAAHS